MVTLLAVLGARRLMSAQVGRQDLLPKSKLSFVLQNPLVIMLLTMMVDIDHLLATPIYAPGRCSILFHPLHTTWPIVAYSLMLAWPIFNKIISRKVLAQDKILGWIGAGLIIHMLLDGLDCLWMRYSG